jgi:hypothetical protein
VPPWAAIDDVLDDPMAASQLLSPKLSDQHDHPAIRAYYKFLLGDDALFNLLFECGPYSHDKVPFQKKGGAHKMVYPEQFFVQHNSSHFEHGRY